MALGRQLLIAPLLALSLNASAALYVTDSITVGVYATPELTGEPELRLISGTAVEVLERRGELLRIRTEHGEQGWLRSRFLTKSQPVVLRMEALRKGQEQLEAQLEGLQEENAGLKRLSAEGRNAAAQRDELEQLRKQNAALTAQLAGQPKSGDHASVDDQVSALQAQLEALQAEKGEVEQRLAATVLIEGGGLADFEGRREPSLMDVEARLPGMALIFIVGGLLGAALSYRIIDRRLMKRFGGIRFH